MREPLGMVGWYGIVTEGRMAISQSSTRERFLAVVLRWRQFDELEFSGSLNN
jgi:hypothetical protein